MTIPANSLAFIALANEYCQAIENADNTVAADFVAAMTRLLPRIYMSAADLDPTVSVSLAEDEVVYIDNVLGEDYYESIRFAVENLLGAEDVYLETFEADMKYSDTPISASVAEGLADIFQVLYNFLEMVRDAPADIVNGALGAVSEDFAGYWSQKVCNVMRPLNNLRYSGALD